MQEHYDVIIIGAGPAGSYLAKSLASSLGRVLIIDKRIGEQECFTDKEKPCSGLVAVPAQLLFTEFITKNQEGIFANPRLLQVRIVDALKRKYVLSKDVVYNINRSEMENILVSKIPNYIDVHSGVFLNHKEIANGKIEVSIKIKNEITVFSTSILVGADGANSKVRNAITSSNENPIEKYTGVEWFVKRDKNVPIQPFFNIILDEELTDYYLWTFPKNNRLLIGGVFKDLRKLQAIPPKLLHHLKELGIIHSVDVEIEKVWAHPILRPLSPKSLLSGNGKNIYLIGEAAGFICPTSAEGYSYAFSSAQTLAKILNKNKTLRLDTPNVFRIMNKVFRKSLIYNSFIRGLYLHIFGKSY